MSTTPLLDTSGMLNGPRRDYTGIAIIGANTSGKAPGGIATISEGQARMLNRSDAYRAFLVPNFEDSSSTKNLYLALKADARLIWLSLTRRISIAHLQVADGLSIERELLTVLIAKVIRLRVVSQWHGAGQIADYESGNLVRRFDYRMLARLSDHNIALGSTVAEYLGRLAPGTPSSIVHNFVDLPRDFLPIREGVPVVAFIGRIGERKGAFDLVIALERLVQNGLEIRAVFAGDGDLMRLTARLRQSEVLTARHWEVKGWLGKDERDDLLELCWAVILPSYKEGLPMALLEAMAAGRAIVATSVGDIPDLFSGAECGCLVPPGDLAALADAIRYVISDGEIAQRLGRNGRLEVMSRFSESSARDSLKAVYRNTLSHRRRRRSGNRSDALI